MRFLCVCVLLQTSNTPNKWRKMNYVDTNRIWQTTLNYYFINLPSATLLPRCDTTKTRNAPNKWWMDFILFTKLDKFHLDLGFVLCIFVPVFSFFFISIFIKWLLRSEKRKPLGDWATTRIILRMVHKVTKYGTVRASAMQIFISGFSLELLFIWSQFQSFLFHAVSMSNALIVHIGVLSTLPIHTKNRFPCALKPDALWLCRKLIKLLAHPHDIYRMLFI